MTWDYLMTWQHDSCRKFLYVAQLWALAPSSFVIVIIRMIIATIPMNDHGDDDDVDNDDNPDQGQPEICVPMTIDSLPGLFFMSGDWFDLNNRQWHRSKYVYSFVLLCHGSWFKFGSIPTTGSGTDQSTFTHLSCFVMVHGSSLVRSQQLAVAQIKVLICLADLRCHGHGSCML